MAAVLIFLGCTLYGSLLSYFQDTPDNDGSGSCNFFGSLHSSKAANYCSALTVLSIQHIPL